MYLATQRDVPENRVVEEHHVLGNEREQSPVIRHAVTLNGNAVELDLTARDIIEPHQQVGKGGLARAGRTHKGNRLPLGNRQIDMMQDIRVRVGKRDIPEGNLLPEAGHGKGIGTVFNLILDGEEVPNSIQRRLPALVIGKGRGDIRHRRDDLREERNVGDEQLRRKRRTFRQN